MSEMLETVHKCDRCRKAKSLAPMKKVRLFAVPGDDGCRVVEVCDLCFADITRCVDGLDVKGPPAP